MPFVKLDIHDSGLGYEGWKLDQILESDLFSLGNLSHLSLLSAYTIIKNHLGSLTLESIPGIGTRFSIYLPLSQSEKNSQIAKARKKGLVLIIDEDYVQSEILKLYLEAAGYEGILYQDHKAAIQWYQKNIRAVDLVVMESYFSDTKGSDLLLEIRKIAANARIAILTENTGKEVEDLMTRGAETIFHKPTSFPTLLSWISEALGRL
jgi:CheY-like chemotaxis protein